MPCRPYIGRLPVAGWQKCRCNAVRPFFSGRISYVRYHHPNLILYIFRHSLPIGCHAGMNWRNINLCPWRMGRRMTLRLDK